MKRLEELISELERNRSVFDCLLRSLPQEVYLYRPNENHWCLLEIVCHLFDEEVEDFRTRVKHVLQTPDLPLKSIAPGKWPKQRQYLEKNFDIVLQGFLDERNASITWLDTLKNAQWESFIDSPDLGKMSALDFLENWLAHDYLHIRQINSVKRAYLDQSTRSDLSYAGNW